MAIQLSAKPNVDAPGGDYSYGKIRDRVGSTPGTPVNTEVYGDFHQFFAALMGTLGFSYNGLPENDVNGYQYYDALVATILRNITGSFPTVGYASTIFSDDATDPITACRIGPHMVHIQGRLFTTDPPGTESAGTRICGVPDATYQPTHDIYIAGAVDALTRETLIVKIDTSGAVFIMNNFNNNATYVNLTYYVIP